MNGRRWRLFVVGAALVTVGCGARAAVPDTTSLERLAAAPKADPWTGTASSRATRLGAGPPVEVAVEAAAPGDRVGAVMRVPGDECLLVLARSAASVEDLDLFIYAEDGAILATDEAADKDASAIVCPPLPRHVYVSARVAAGHGVVAIVAHPIESARAAEFAKAFDIRSSAGVTEAEEPWGSIDESIGRRRRTVGGVWRGLRKLVVPTDPRIPTRVSADIEAGGCVDVLAVPSGEVAHLDLTALDREGRIIARAGGMPPERALLLCSPVATTVTIELRPHAGRGGVALVLASAAIGEIDLDGDIERIDVMATGPLDENLDQLARELSPRHYAPASLVFKGDLAVGTRRSAEVASLGGCTRIDVQLGAPSLGVDAWVWDADGNLVAHGSAGNGAVLFACGPPGKLRLDLEALSRGGPFVAERRALAVTAPALAKHPLAAGRLLGKLEALGLLPSVAVPVATTAVTLSADKAVRVPVTVPVGRCVTVVAAVGADATGVVVRLRREPNGIEVAATRGTYSAAARVCAVDAFDTLEVVAEVTVAAGVAPGLVTTRQTDPTSRPGEAPPRPAAR